MKITAEWLEQHYVSKGCIKFFKNNGLEGIDSAFILSTEGDYRYYIYEIKKLLDSELVYNSKGNLILVRNDSYTARYTRKHKLVRKIKLFYSKIARLSRLVKVNIYTYDNNGNVLTVVYPSGVKKTFEYDEHNNMINNNGVKYTFTKDDFSLRITKEGETILNMNIVKDDLIKKPLVDNSWHEYMAKEYSINKVLLITCDGNTDLVKSVINNSGGLSVVINTKDIENMIFYKTMILIGNDDKEMKPYKDMVLGLDMARLGNNIYKMNIKTHYKKGKKVISDDKWSDSVFNLMNYIDKDESDV